MKDKHLLLKISFFLGSYSSTLVQLLPHYQDMLSLNPGCVTVVHIWESDRA